ncbi:hypothetical protein D3C83_309530 [compost metagenome]
MILRSDSVWMTVLMTNVSSPNSIVSSMGNDAERDMSKYAPSRRCLSPSQT